MATLKKPTGRRLKSKQQDPKLRAAKRHRQAGRAYDAKRDDKNEARIAALEAGTWPKYAALFLAAFLALGCVNTVTPTEPAARASSRTSLAIAGSMPSPPCIEPQIGVPAVFNLSDGTPSIRWTCEMPPVVCPAFTVYREQSFAGATLRYCSPTGEWPGPAVEPTPEPTPTPGPVQHGLPPAPILLSGPRS